MQRLRFLTIAVILAALAGPSFNVLARPLGDTTPDLGTANPFAVLAGSAISDTPISAIDGDVGLDPSGGGSITGLTCDEMVGASTIYDNDGGYTGNGGSLGTACLTTDAGLVLGAKNALVVAYDRLAATDNASCDRDVAGVDNLSLLSPLGPGVYCATAFIIPTDLVLSGSGIWIFRSASTIDTDPDVTVSGGDSCSVWWRAETSVTIGTGNTVVGNFLALASISDDGGSTINGRFLARNQAVTLNNTTINRGALCASTTTEEEEEEVVEALPDTGAAPIRNEGFPWSLVILGGLSAIALVVGVRANRRTHLPKQ
ncbi:MAG: ice-binding family protein [Anaerolineales bacterium]